MTQHYVRPIKSALDEVKKRASNAEWEGNQEQANILWKRYDDLLKRCRNGEMYEVMF